MPKYQILSFHCVIHAKIKNSQLALRYPCLCLVADGKKRHGDSLGGERSVRGRHHATPVPQVGLESLRSVLFYFSSLRLPRVSPYPSYTSRYLQKGWDFWKLELVWRLFFVVAWLKDIIVLPLFLWGGTREISIQFWSGLIFVYCERSRASVDSLLLHAVACAGRIGEYEVLIWSEAFLLRDTHV